MALIAGSRLGPYEILSPLGAGGMGEVWKARDTRLGREVAIKVLPQHLSSSADARQRFEREAKTISTLSHPHICALYDVGNQDGLEYLVMEYLEGETLSERLARGALSIEQALRYSIEIADALDRAHRQGIVHRDLKPGNVMLTRSGVKLLDFGLAKAVQPNAGQPATALPTMTDSPNLTREGTIVGTFQYMAPEQLEGKEADARTDIFALGAVLYEMVTGRKAFTGSTQPSLMSAILRDEPQPISLVAPMSPPALDRVVKTCLAKDPEERWQSARDVASALKWTTEGSQSEALGPRITRRRTRERLAWTVAGFSLLAALGLAALLFRRAPVEARPTRFFIFPPEETTIAMGPAAPQAALSPDGRLLVMAATTADRKTHLWVRPLDSLTARKLAGTEDGFLPFWSPDSRFIGFFAQGKLKKVEVSGGPSQTLCDAPSGNGATWNRDGVILFAPNREGGLVRVSAMGGIPTGVTKLDRRRMENSHVWPQFLPDGRHFLYLALAGRRENRGIYVRSLESTEARQVLKSEVRAAYSPPGYLLFIQHGTLMAQRFDPNRLTISGEPVQVGEGVSYNPSNGRTTFTVSENGVLAYRTGTVGGIPPSELVWFDRDGKRLGSVGGPALNMRLALAPDGNRIAVQRRDPQVGTDDIWLIDQERSTVSRLTFGSFNQTHPVWSPDGSRIVFTSDREGASNLYQKISSGAGGEELLLQSDTAKYVTDLSPDGKYIAYENQASRTGSDVWVLRLFGDRKAIPVLRTEANEGLAQFSPDGRWMAYVSDESGRKEVYVQAFPTSGGKWQISLAGGSFPRWRRDGKELFYIAADQQLMAVAVQANSTFQSGQPRVLFEPRFFNIPVIPYTVSADGQRFLFNTPTEETSPSPVIVVLNWTAELKRR